MKKTSNDAYAVIIENVALSFGNIVETLFSLRKWKCSCNRDMIEDCIRSYLWNRPSQFWSALEGGTGNQQSGICRDVIRTIDKTLNLRRRLQAEIVDIFSDPERFDCIMAGKIKPLNNGLSKTVSAISRSRKNMSPQNSNPDRGIERKNGKEKIHPSMGKNEGGLPRIGPGTRLYGSNLSKAQEKVNLQYWTEHQEELYNG